jgi:hypothetical protein
LTFLDFGAIFKIIFGQNFRSKNNKGRRQRKTKERRNGWP